MFGILFWICAISILYAYAGYPLILAALARLRPAPAPPPPPDEWPTVTLLIAAYDEEQVIGEKLANTFALDYPRERLHVLVAADGSTDGTARIVGEHAAQGVELSYLPERQGKSAAINRAVPQARGEIVVFSDANNVYDTRAIRALVLPFGDPSVGAVTGSKRIVEDRGTRLGASEGLYWRYESFIKQQETRLGCSVGAAGEILAIRRALFVPIPDGIINDDLYLAARMVRQGYRVVYAPAAQSYEHVSASAGDEVIRRARIVAGRFQAALRIGELLPWNRPLVAWQLVSHKLLRPLVPFAMIGALAANVLAALFPIRAGGLAGIAFLAPPLAWIMLIGQIGFYALAAIGNRVKIGGLIGRLLYLPTFLVNSNYAALAGLIDYARGRQTALWQRVARRDEQH